MRGFLRIFGILVLIACVAFVFMACNADADGSENTGNPDGVTTTDSGGQTNPSQQTTLPGTGEAVIPGGTTGSSQGQTNPSTNPGTPSTDGAGNETTGPVAENTTGATTVSPTPENTNPTTDKEPNIETYPPSSGGTTPPEDPPVTTGASDTDDGMSNDGGNNDEGFGNIIYNPLRMSY